MSGNGFKPGRSRLDNGLTVLHQRNPASGAVTISLSLAAGAVFEAPGQAGLATLLARGLTRGTAWRNKEEIGEVLDFRGAHLAGSGGRHSAGLGARARSEDFEAVLELVAQSARQPSFPEAEFDKLVGDRLTALREDDDDPAAVVMKRFRELVYGPEHPYGSPLKGDEETIRGLEVEDLRQFHAARYGPEAALLVVVGGVEHDRVLQASETLFGDWDNRGIAAGFRAAQAAVPDAPVLDGVQRAVVQMPDKTQVDIALGHASIRRADERYFAAALLNMVLGVFAMGGRLGRSVREEQGMAYYTYSSLSPALGPGPFVVRAGVQPQHVEPALTSIVAEIERIRTEPVGERELEDAKAATIRSLPRMLESNEGMADILQRIELYDLGLDYLERFPREVAAVQPEALLGVAQDLLDVDSYALAIAGPYAPGDS